MVDLQRVCVPRPGAPGGPCTNRCEHGRCEHLRAAAAASCSTCARPIGYGVEHRRLDAGTEVLRFHLDCSDRRVPCPEVPEDPVAPYRPVWAVVAVVDHARRRGLRVALGIACAACGASRTSPDVPPEGGTHAWALPRGWAALCPSCLGVVARAVRTGDRLSLEAAAQLLAAAQVQAGEVAP